MDTTPITISRQDLERLEHHLYFDTVRALPGCSMLREELVRANVVQPEDIGANVVTMNSTVRFVDEQAGEPYELTLVYPDQAGDPGTVSVFAPVGSALLGLSVGQTIEWQVPGGRQLCLRVDSVVDQPEAQLQFHR
ncbi:MAG TPA: nucleoside diphosphate kinase regulator [Woeseiaceae bacterium]|nr:nucleoside diphosphate kinase regulator [Woeseiaceae bacterium]